jgi:hypothetical protein
MRTMILGRAFALSKSALRRVLGRPTGLLVGLVAAFAAPLVFTNSTVAQGQGYVFAGSVSVPGNPLVSFGNSWVDPTLNMYFLADRSNKAIDFIPLQANPPVFQIIPTGPYAFAGDGAGGSSGDFGPTDAGPNGITTVIDPPGTPLQLFVADAPTPGYTVSTVKVFTAAGLPNPTHVIPTGGRYRSNQLCWAPPNPTGAGTTVTLDVPHAPSVRPNGVILVTNDYDGFISFIPTSGPSAYSVVNKIGIEAGNGQCVYDPTTDLFYLTNPNSGVIGTQPGAVVAIDPTTGIIGTFQVNLNFCAAPQGIALGSRTTPGVPGSSGDGQILLGCNAPSVGGPLDGLRNTVSINNTTGAIVNIYENLGGNDQVYHTETPAIGPNGDWFLAGGSFLPFEQVAAVSPFVSSGITGTAPSPAIITAGPIGFPGVTTRTTHSIASWAGNVAGLGLLEAAIFPVPANGGGSPGFASPICGGNASVGCIAFYIQSPITE